ncbi:MAG TPA: hypothetical protein VK563_15885 [Puia sp.]|nr:hypothetical protein [Puia sp.]
MNLFKWITRLLDILLYIFRLVGIEIRKLQFASRGPEPKDSIAISDKVTDFMEVFKPTRLFFVFNILAGVIFLALPQGKDVVLIVIEDLSAFHFGSLLSLLVGVAGWAVLAEFGARYKIYISDNSGKSLSGSRVNYRKQLQRFFSMVYLLLPFLVVLLGVVTVTLSNLHVLDGGSEKSFWSVAWPFSTVIILLILVSAGLARFYLDDGFNVRFRKDPSWKWAVDFFKLPKEEEDWANKLYGIYNDYIFTIRKTSFFNNSEPAKKLKKAYKRFVAIVKSMPAGSFPDHLILESEQAPLAFRPPTHFENEYLPNFRRQRYKYVINNAGSYRWVYKNVPAFYRTLHRQVRTIALSSLAVILLISVNFLYASDWIGAPGLVCLSFGCWQGVYSGLLYIDYRYRKGVFISIRWLLVAWFLIVSYVDADHPVHYNEQGKMADTRLSLNSHFNRWFGRHLQDSAHLTRWKGGTALSDTCHSDPDWVYPVIFITAEGGALRTGAFTAMLLAGIQDHFPEFRKDIYAFSTVSGGSVGVSFFNAVNYLEVDTTAIYDTTYYRRKSREFFSKDLLSPVLSKMFYGDILNYFWPVHIGRLDRAIALEEAWEHDYHKIFKKTGDRNIYSSDFIRSQTCNPDVAPAWFINTTEVESGLQCFLSNTKPDSFLFYRDRDLLLEKLRGGVNYSTAVNFSSRFPLISPSAAVRQNGDRTYHYVDGGYVENTGAKTMLEILQSLKDSLCHRHIKPYVIQLRFGDKDEYTNTGFLNEISSVGYGIYDIRGGYSRTYTELLKNYTERELGGNFIQVPLEATAGEVPLNWVLSTRSMGNIDSAIAGIFHNKFNELHRKLFFFEGNIPGQPTR